MAPLQLSNFHSNPIAIGHQIQSLLRIRASVQLAPAPNGSRWPKRFKTGNNGSKMEVAMAAEIMVVFEALGLIARMTISSWQKLDFKDLFF